MLRSVAFFLLACAAPLVSCPALADTIQTLKFSAILNQNSPLTGGISGTLTLDETTGVVTGSEFAAGTSQGLFDFTSSPDSQQNGPPTTSISFTSDDGSANFLLILPVANLQGYNGGSICSLQMPCADSLRASFAVNDQQSSVSFGTITGGDAPVPEPGTLGMVGLGLLASASGLYRRFA